MSKRKYNPSWEDIPQFSEWLKQSSNDNGKAFCKWCNSEIRSHVSDLKNHMKTNNHIKKSEDRKRQKTSKHLKIEIMAAVSGCKNRMVVLREDIIARSCELLGLENECEIRKKIRSDFRMKITFMEDGRPNLICIRDCRASEIIPILEKHGYEFHMAKSHYKNGAVEVFWEFMKKV